MLVALQGAVSQGILWGIMVLGVGVGLLVCGAGVAIGGRAFDRRGSRLMEFAEAT